jgi:hypothetical protein
MSTDDLLRRRFDEMRLERALGGTPTAVVGKATWTGNADDYSDQQWASACVCDYGLCGNLAMDWAAKQRYALPIKAPGSSRPDPEGLQRAAARLPQMQGVCPAAKREAAVRLVAAGNQIGAEITNRYVLTLAGA